MKVFNRDDNIVNLYRLEVKGLGEHEGIAKFHNQQWRFWLQMKVLPSFIGW